MSTPTSTILQPHTKNPPQNSITPHDMNNLSNNDNQQNKILKVKENSIPLTKSGFPDRRYSANKNATISPSTPEKRNSAKRPVSPMSSEKLSQPPKKRGRPPKYPARIEDQPNRKNSSNTPLTSQNQAQAKDTPVKHHQDAPIHSQDPNDVFYLQLEQLFKMYSSNEQPLQPERWITGQEWNDYMVEHMQDSVHILHPDTFSKKSILSNNREESEEGCIDLLHHLDELKKAERVDVLTKPVITMLNTKAAQYRKSPNKLDGSHWLLFAIIPKGYTSPIHGQLTETLRRDTAPKYDEVYLLDPLGKKKPELPLLLKYMLTNGYKSTRTIEEMQIETFYNKLSDNIDVHEISTEQQIDNTSDCGIWAIFNAFYLSHTCSSKFLSAISKPTSRAPGSSLRKGLEGNLYPTGLLESQKEGEPLNYEDQDPKMKAEEPIHEQPTEIPKQKYDSRIKPEEPPKQEKKQAQQDKYQLDRRIAAIEAQTNSFLQLNEQILHKFDMILNQKFNQGYNQPHRQNYYSNYHHRPYQKQYYKNNYNQREFRQYQPRYYQPKHYNHQKYNQQRRYEDEYMVDEDSETVTYQRKDGYISYTRR